MIRLFDGAKDFRTAAPVAVLASLIGILMPDGSPIPMGIRATVSLIEVHSAVPLEA